MHRETLRLRKKVLGEEHPSTLASLNNLALALSGQEKYAEAEQMHRYTLDRREEIFGEEHLATLISLHNLAQALNHQGRYDNALPLYKQACTGFWAILGLDDPITQACFDHYTSVQQAADVDARAADAYCKRMREEALHQHLAGSVHVSDCEDDGDWEQRRGATCSN
jgi:tetratricopeptide (TPR) repeat protein